MHKWFTVYTRPRFEKKVATELNEKGIECFLPLYKTLKQWSDRKKMVEIPVFNSYLFVHIDYENQHNDILSIPGIIKFVRFGKDLAVIRQSEIDDIKLVLNYSDSIEVISTQSLKVASPVQITSGPMKGLKGFITEQRGNKLFTIQIEQLEASLVFTVPAKMLISI
jgi:transcription antitermination factor NusG